MSATIKRFTAIVLAASVAPWVLAGAEPDPKEALRRAVNPPQVVFDGDITVTYWHPRGTSSEEVRVAYNSPARCSWQFFSPSGQIIRTMVMDGGREQIAVMERRRSYSGAAPRSAPKRMPPEQEWRLLLANYSVSFDGEEPIAGYPCVIVSLTPRTEGKPIQKLWLEKRSGVILQIRRFQPETGAAMVSRFTRFDPRPRSAAPEPRIEMVPANTVDRSIDPDFMSLESLQREGDFVLEVPRGIRDGFVFESGDVMTVGEDVVRQVRYTDGLCVLSLFQTPRPAKSPEKYGDNTDPGRAGMLEVVSWNQSGRYYTLIGDVTENLLGDISRSFRSE